MLIVVVAVGTLLLGAGIWYTSYTLAVAKDPVVQQNPPMEADPFHIDQPKSLKTISDPCQLLNPQQLKQLASLPTGVPEESLWDQQACRWRNRQLTVSISPDTTQGLGLKNTAKNVSDGVPTGEVSGYPVVHYGQSAGSCGTYVGTSATELLLVSFQVGADGRSNPEYADPCAMSDKITDMVLSNLPEE
ncbi:DUF3558 domain-containing protein [Saccharopolyspora indica]|uniref:DUF3558 domain-containing protein n=1 Tax=Saccharopolyspora indica TaxID=1229659 RepID=UPI0022EB190E|nr:DUF3558 domain-containing protein [Saccharopolyspora indica]MDA3648722.1 DUF3558 domain-containing protein [Saccharopolyspora indica]